METPKRLQPLPDTLRRLYSLSGNQCAYPGCCQPMFNNEGNFVGQICHIEGAKLIPLSEFVQRMNELNSADNIVLHCHHGVRSMQALQILREAGFNKIKSMAGGINAWSEDVDPDVPRY